MKRSGIVAVLLVASGALAQGQPFGPAAELPEKMAIEMAVQAGGFTNFALETRVTRNAPYSAEAVNEFVQVLADGNRIVRRTMTRVYRDSDGRTRREQIEDGQVRSIVISDPVSGMSIVLDPGNRTAHRAAVAFARTAGGDESKPAMAAGTMSIMRSPAPAGRFVATGPVANRIAEGSTPPVKEDLGTQMIEGIAAAGTRTTTTIAAGAIGNDQPIVVVSEQWYSRDLAVLLQTRHSDPRVGETTYRLTNVQRAEPDSALFQMPTDYALKESTFRPRP